MADNPGATRRTFLKGGALLAAPLAAASVTVVALADDGLKQRLTRLEDEAAIRTLHQSWLRQINAFAHHAGAPDKIEIAADGHSAVGHYDLAVQLETPLARDSTLAQMAYVQGDGTVRRTEHRTLTVDYTRVNHGVWAIRKVTPPLSN